MLSPPTCLDEQNKRAEFEALQEEHEAQHKEISARGRMALADFLLGTSDMTSPSSAGGRLGGLPTVMEETSPTGAVLAGCTPRELATKSSVALFRVVVPPCRLEGE